MNKQRNAFSSYTAQIWDDDALISEIGGLSLDAAREICRAAPLTEHCGRVWCEDIGVNYNEVYARDGSIRRGKFEEMILVRYHAEHSR